jgi:hypothetical protein
MLKQPILTQTCVPDILKLTFLTVNYASHDVKAFSDSINTPMLKLTFLHPIPVISIFPLHLFILSQLVFELFSSC